MVLSHSKLKRKRKEELVALGASGDAIPETDSAAVVAPDSVDEGKKNKQKDKGKKKKKKQETNGAVANASEVELITSNGAVRADGVEVVEVKKEDKKSLKKEKKERRKAAQLAVLSLAAPSTAEENGGHEVQNRTDEAASNGGEKAEQPVDEKETTATSTERPLSVRERKGKKKKGTKDRWGVKVVEEDEQDEVPVVAKPVTEAPSISTSGEEELYEAKKVYVGGFPYTCTEDDIHEYFSECGVISELDCMIFPDTGNFRGIAFLTFETEEGAANALQYDGSDMGGRFLKIVKCKRSSRAPSKVPHQGEVQKTPGSTSAYIGNLSWDITEEAIKNIFKKAYPKSNIDAVRLAFDRVSGDFKGFGHIDFGDDESLEAAVKLNQTSLLGRPMKVAYSVPLKQSAVNGNGAKSESRSGGTCYICGTEGHKAHFCPMKGANADDNYGSKKVAACYICGEEGHKAFLCPQKKAK